MIFDKETNRWYLNESHLNACKAGLERNARLQKHLPLQHSAVVEQAARWNAMKK